MYDMYPDWAESLTERGEAGLGHPNYPVEAPRKHMPATTAEAMQPGPDAHTSMRPETQHSLGYVGIKEMVSE